MNIVSYIKNLSHKFGRNQIQKSCELTINSINTHTIPAYVSASDLFKNHKLKSKETLAFVTTFTKLASIPRPGTIIEAILEVLRTSVTTLEMISKKSETIYADQESNLGLSFQKATYLRLVTSITFTNEYARKFLNYLYILETADADESFSLKDNITPAEVQYLKSQFINFCTCANILQNNIEDIELKVDNLPDAIVSDSTEKTLSATLGEKAIDPLGFRNFAVPIRISTYWNLFYLLGIVIADYQSAAYKCAKEELDLLQLRKINLEKVYAKSPDAKLQKEIEYLSSRISGLNYELQREEYKNA